MSDPSFTLSPGAPRLGNVFLATHHHQARARVPPKSHDDHSMQYWRPNATYLPLISGVNVTQRITDGLKTCTRWQLVEFPGSVPGRNAPCAQRRRQRSNAQGGGGPRGLLCSCHASWFGPGNGATAKYAMAPGTHQSRLGELDRQSPP